MLQCSTKQLTNPPLWLDQWRRCLWWLQLRGLSFNNWVIICSLMDECHFCWELLSASFWTPLCLSKDFWIVFVDGGLTLGGLSGSVGRTMRGKSRYTEPVSASYRWPIGPRTGAAVFLLISFLHALDDDDDDDILQLTRWSYQCDFCAKNKQS